MKIKIRVLILDGGPAGSTATATPTKDWKHFLRQIPVNHET
jgi:hypothetical protein